MNKCPLVMCLTNTVAANFTANCLLSIGARPAMVEEPSEAEELAGVADALLVNIGTVSERQADAMRRAIAVAKRRGLPWVLDPVGVQLLAYRRELALEFLALRPTLVRGNLAEIASLGELNVPSLATGKIDMIRPAGKEIRGGVEMLQTVTATGCAQGALCAAFLGWDETPEGAAESAAHLLKRAGELAWEKAREPGSFQVALLDALWRLTND